jgi:polyribonucleotide nucleotidyltransferase
MINEIIATHKVQIDIEDSGMVMVTSANPESLQKAVDWIKQLTREVKAGEFFEGPVTRILDFGAFVEILPKVEGLVHVSELAPYRVAQVTDIVSIGKVVKVVVKEIDSMGRLNLSMKAAPGNEYPPAPAAGAGGDSHPGGGDRPRFGGGGDRSSRGPARSGGFRRDH